MRHPVTKLREATRQCETQQMLYRAGGTVPRQVSTPLKMKSALLLSHSLVAPPALADVWECRDVNGNKRFTNIKDEAEKNGCTRLNAPLSPELQASIQAAERRAASQRAARSRAKLGMTTYQAKEAGWDHPLRVTQSRTSAGTFETRYYLGAAYDFSNGKLVAIHELK